MEIHRRVQAVSVALLQPLAMCDNAYVLRQLQPVEDRIALARAAQTPRELNDVGRTMVRWSHGGNSAVPGVTGSAIADELIDFGQRKKWKDKLVTVAQACATLVRKDAATLNAAFDDGAFGP